MLKLPTNSFRAGSPFLVLQHISKQLNENILYYEFLNTVQFSRSVMSDSLRPHWLQHARSPCPSPTPGVYPNSCPLSWWCHPTISSSVIPSSSCPQSFPESGSFQMRQLLAWGGQSIGVSASASVFPMNIPGCSLKGFLKKIPDVNLFLY